MRRSRSSTHRVATRDSSDSRRPGWDHAAHDPCRPPHAARLRQPLLPGVLRGAGPAQAPTRRPTNAVRGFLDMIASLVIDAPAHATSSPAGTTTGGRSSGSTPSRRTRPTAWPDGSLTERGDARGPRPAGAGHPSTRWRLWASRGSAPTATRPTTSSAPSSTRRGGQVPVDVVTGDRDLFQLVDDAAGVRVLYTARGGVRDPDLVDEAFLAREVCGVVGARLRRHGGPAR